MKREKNINFLTFLFFLTYGAVMLDVNSITFFSDVLMKQLNISVTQYSGMNSAVWFTFAISSVVVGILADVTGKRKIFLGPLIIGAGVSSILLSFMRNYNFILFFRLILGFCSGSCLSMMMSIIAKNLIKDDYGFRNGIVSCGSAVIASTIGPILLTRIVLYSSWSGSFLFTGITNFLIGLVILFSVKEVQYDKVVRKGNRTPFISSVIALSKNQNFILCLIIGCLECAGKITLGVFGPIYLTDIAFLDTVTKGNCLSIMGLIFIPVCFVIPSLADKFSSKKVMLITFFCSLLSPLSMFLFKGSMMGVVAYVIFGNWAASTVALFCYVIPKASLPESLLGTANGLIMGMSVLFGACLWPLLMATFSESTIGIIGVIGIAAILFLVCIILTLFIKEKDI